MANNEYKTCNGCGEHRLMWFKRDGKWKLGSIDFEKTKEPSNFHSSRPKIFIKIHKCKIGA